MADAKNLNALIMSDPTWKGLPLWDVDAQKSDLNQPSPDAEQSSAQRGPCQDEPEEEDRVAVEGAVSDSSAAEDT